MFIVYRREIMNTHPLFSFCRGVARILSGRFRLLQERVGGTVTAQNGVAFTVFRQGRFTPPGPGGESPPGARFTVRFHVKNMSPERNKRFSLLTIPFFVGMPGFRSKLWLVNEDVGDFMGIYEWQTERDARNYSTSFAMHFMTNRSEEGSVSFDIEPL